MPSTNEIRASLERQYAIALGHFEAAERAVETIVGLKAMIEADARITAEKKKLREKMDRIAHLLRVQVDPDWEPGHIRPIRPRKTVRRQGALSIAAYKALKVAKAPLKTREIANLIAPELGVAPSDYRQINRIDVAVRAALLARAKDGMVVLHEGSPARWSIKRIDPREQARAFACSSSRSIL